MKKFLTAVMLIMLMSTGVFAENPVYIAFLWHMHQPVYWPGEDIVETSHNSQCTDSVVDYLTWPDRNGAYTSYPIDAIARFMYMPHAGAQISYSGSLIENLDTLSAHGIGYGRNWADRYREASNWKTELGNPRIDMVGFGYFHPLMAFLEYKDIRKHIQLHRSKIEEKFNQPGSKGLFPPENAFAERMIPALVDEGFQWVLVDNLHFDRANRDYPWKAQQKMIPPNRADARNKRQWNYEDLTCQQNTVNTVSVPFAMQPHYVEYIDPETKKAITPDGRPARMIAVPTERSIGYDDSYGDRSPIERIKQVERYNTDSKHPMLIVLAHDGDNAGASGTRYYFETLQWIAQNPDKYKLTTVEDYLDMFPPDKNDIIHVEDGSWAGADIGDQEFKKWNGDPWLNGVIDHKNGVSSDRSSWASIIAARNLVHTAYENNKYSSSVEKAWRYLMEGETSCYWYWDGTYEWDDKPTLACNLAYNELKNSSFSDKTAPSLFPPQREPYNPGGIEWGEEMKRNFTVWTLCYDVSGLSSVKLYYQKADNTVTTDDLIYNNGKNWESISMEKCTLKQAGRVKPAIRAEYYLAEIRGMKDQMINYYVEACDTKGNISKSPVSQVYVGTLGDSEPLWSPENPVKTDTIRIVSKRPGMLHWGVNGWQKPADEYISSDSVDWNDGKAVETPLKESFGKYYAEIGPFAAGDVEKINFIFHFADNSWDKDHTIYVSQKGRSVAANPETGLTDTDRAQVIRAEILRETPDNQAKLMEKCAGSSIISVVEQEMFEKEQAARLSK